MYGSAWYLVRRTRYTQLSVLTGSFHEYHSRVYSTYSTAGTAAEQQYQAALKNTPFHNSSSMLQCPYVINTSYQKLPFGSGDYPDKLLYHQALN